VLTTCHTKTTRKEGERGKGGKTKREDAYEITSRLGGKKKRGKKWLRCRPAKEGKGKLQGGGKKRKRLIAA